jgi:ABC-2 type transport system ATP-binding protein
VFVRTHHIDTLKKALTAANHEFTESDGGLVLHGIKTDEVGQIAFGAGLAVLELTSRSASLEEAFLELTADAQEYKSHAEKGDQ